ncbi:Glycine N-acyltransferase-like protein [Caenorhabditis elegans]|uniref:Glycine N-acyltransferase-like protein n=1 Tax=Caenorhabditis elegans TaxID=6239 RepID=O44195_CAEEL|nr:Glycine N-acyltransferase-like protein [Caenorhabditis elegans]CCD70161.1 Glycine N-acyltransferase-like protein [Caenorhabditis elegans]|eukprot:NP_500585.2 Uncharacterized protein CELE_ZK185.3 [Caenorhabditis elegans]
MFAKLSVHQLRDLLPFFTSHPKFALFANAVKFEIEKRLPNHPCDFYSYQKSEENAKYFYCFRHNRLPDSCRPILMIGSVQTTVNGDDVICGLEQIKNSEPEFENIILLVASTELAKLANKYLTTCCNIRENYNVPCNNFYLPITVCPEIQEKVDGITLPVSFSIGSTRLEDAEIVNSTWKFATPEDILQQKEKIQRLPTACIFHEEKPIAFEMIGLHGQLSHQYTMPGYRNRGFGAIIENSIVSKCFREGITPVKSVELSNEPVLKRSLEHPLWEIVKDENGDKVIFDYIEYY